MVALSLHDCKIIDQDINTNRSKYTYLYNGNGESPFSYHMGRNLSHLMGKPTICIGENKGADQLRSNCEADQRLCFRYTDSTIPLLLKSEISSFYLFPVLVQVGLCQSCSGIILLVFPRGGSFIKEIHHYVFIRIKVNVTSTLDHVLTASLPRSKNSRTWRGRGQIETISDF